MEKNVNPSRIYWFVTLPQALLVAILAISLADRMRAGALSVLIAGAAVGVASTAYAAFSHRQRPAIGNAALAALSAASCAMLSASALLLDGTLFGGFLRLRLAALFLNAVTALFAVVALAKSRKLHADAGRRVIALAALPFAWFLAFNVTAGVRLETAAVILIVAGALAAVYLLVRVAKARGAEALAASGALKRGTAALFLVFSIGMPLMGLMFNLSMGNLFGDFSSPWFFVVPIANGALLLIPPPPDKRLRLLRFAMLSAASVYFVYFFVVFIPYLPLGFYGLLFIVGVFLFAPAGALAMQAIELLRERRHLLPLYGGVRLALSFGLALLLIPACMLSSVVGDRQNLANAMAYLEASDAAPGASVDVGRLGRTLDNASVATDITRTVFTDFRFASNTPFLSAAYSALALDGKVMKGGDITQLRRLYFDAPDAPDAPGSDGSIAGGRTVNGDGTTEVRLANIEAKTVYDSEIGASRTWVDLTLQGGWNRGGDEYVALFALPDGAYVSDYYLEVGAERRYGVLADERAAMSVYESIVRVRRDPGVVRYANDSQLELRVFPFGKGEVRHTGFAVIHSQSFDFTLDGMAVTLDAVDTPEEVPFRGGVLLSGALKQGLPAAAAREPEYYFVVDSSAHSPVGYLVSMAMDFASMAGIGDARVVFASYGLTEVPLKDARDASVTPQCGFNLALAVKKILTENGDGTCPVIIYATSNPAGAILPERCSALARRFPDSQYYYRLRDDMSLVPYAFGGNQPGEPVAEPVIMPMRLYQGSYVRDDGQGEVVALPGAGGYAVSGSQYLDALALDAASRRRPSMDAAESLMMLRASFRAHVLTRQTAFIVVETADQEAEIWRAQELLMEQDSAAAAATDPATLDEPPLALMAALACAALVCAALLARRRPRRPQAKGSFTMEVGRSP